MGEFLQSSFQIFFCLVAGIYLSWKLALVGLSLNVLIAFAGKFLVTAVAEAQV
jgi:hypothetical protein